jgi:outer membrane protein TolC
LGISLEVIDAQLSLEKTKLDRVISLYQYYKNLASIYELIGTPNKFLEIYN